MRPPDTLPEQCKDVEKVIAEIVVLSLMSELWSLETLTQLRRMASELDVLCLQRIHSEEVSP